MCASVTPEKPLYSCANLAILLAMAGIDTSHVREPDYDPAALRMSTAKWDVRREQVETARWIWDNPDAARVQVYPDLRAGDATHACEKQVYYLHLCRRQGADYLAPDSSS